MKEYPSIARNFEEIPNAHIFAKIDGCNTRMAWVRKKGWTKFGSRHVLIDTSDPILGPAIPLFNAKLAEPLAKILHDARCKEAIVFCEYWGKNSFAGQHEPGDPMFITLIDAALDKKGMIDPRDFLSMFYKSDIEVAHYIGRENWTRGFVDRVWNGDVAGASMEGVVGKSGTGTKWVARKAKSKVWIDAIHKRYDEKTAEKLINS